MMSTYVVRLSSYIFRVKNSENHYKMLDIQTTATVPEVKKAYKKLALLLHPDKNSAPNSGEVFTSKYDFYLCSMSNMF